MKSLTAEALLAIPVDKPELLFSAYEGADVAAVSKSWSGSTAMVVGHALAGMSSSTSVAVKRGSVVRFPKK